MHIAQDLSKDPHFAVNLFHLTKHVAQTLCKADVMYGKCSVLEDGPSGLKDDMHV